MATKVFLSLSHIDGSFVKKVHERLPAGLAYFYEQSFENGEQLIAAMERAVRDSAVFVLFASAAAKKSPWVGFEIAEARVQQIIKPRHRILIFPVDAEASLEFVPDWMKSYWVPKAGLSAADIARYITTILLEPNVGLSSGAVKVVGRGKTLDRLEQISADFIARRHKSPSVYFLSGFRGVGRRTFAAYFMRIALSAQVNLPYGPSLILPPQADLIDIYRSLRAELSQNASIEKIQSDQKAFSELSQTEQIGEVIRLLGHFANLGQSVTLLTASGFFEDRGEPKSWVFPLFNAVPVGLTIFAISNRQLAPELIAQNNLVQMRVDELQEGDVRALMIFTAEKFGIKEFSISDNLVKAIGGHADVANAAVRLAAVKGMHILERDPRQLFNIQNTILGESIDPASLDATQIKILSLLSWVPSLNGLILEKVLIAEKANEQDIVDALTNLVLGCLVISSGSDYAISPAIRFLFRRFNVSPTNLLKTFSAILSKEWDDSKKLGIFRSDLFEAFVFMHSLEGRLLPKELVNLLTPGLLAEVVREAYAKGKDESDFTSLEKVVSWGEIADQMRMSEDAREEILSTVARSKIRLGKFDEANATIDGMAKRGYRSVPFLRGHALRRNEEYSKAIEILKVAVAEEKYNRSAVHELALAYKKSGRLADLRKLLKEHGNLIRDSSMFADFQIGVDLARGDLTAAETGIANLRLMPDDEGRSDIRAAQLQMRRNQYKEAKEALTALLRTTRANALRIRSIRAICAARDNDFAMADEDVQFVKKFPAWQAAGIRLDANLLVERDRPKEARAMLDKLPQRSAEDMVLYARALEKEADLPSTGVEDRRKFVLKASEIRSSNNFAFEYDFTAE